MSGSITINLPLKPYLIKYLIKKYGDFHIVSRNSWLGSYLIEILDKKYRRSGTIKDGDYYKIIVPKNIVKGVGFDMPAIKYIKLEQMIDKLFRNDLYSYIDVSIDNDLLVSNTYKSSFTGDLNKVIHKQNVVKALNQFFKTYNIIEDDLKMGTIYRDYSRHINKKRTVNENNKTNRLVS